MLKDTQPPRYSVPRTRRTYTLQFKSELLTACKQPGASIAALALQHGMNANVLHRWLKDHRQGTLLLGDGPSAPALIPIDLAASRPVSGSEAELSASPPHPTSASSSSITPSKSPCIGLWTLPANVPRCCGLLR